MAAIKKWSKVSGLDAALKESSDYSQNGISMSSVRFGVPLLPCT